MQIPRLREWRERRALTQDELAELADLSTRSVAGYEAGSGARPGTVRKLAAALNISVDDLQGKAPGPASLQESFNDVLAEEHFAQWEQAASNARHFRESAKDRLSLQIGILEEMRDDDAPEEERRRPLDEMGRILDEANQARTRLLDNLQEGLDGATTRTQRAGPNTYWEEFQTADRLYQELVEMVGAAGLSMRRVKPGEGVPSHHEVAALAG